MTDYTMDITKEELDLILGDLSDDGKIGKKAEKAIRARIEEGKAKGYPMWEVRRQLRCKVGPAEGKKIGDAMDKLW